MFFITLTVPSLEKSVNSLMRKAKKLSSFSFARAITIPTGIPSGNTAEYPLVIIVSPIFASACRGNSSRIASLGNFPSQTSEPKLSFPFNLQESLKSGFKMEMMRAVFSPTMLTMPTTPFYPQNFRRSW